MSNSIEQVYQNSLMADAAYIHFEKYTDFDSSGNILPKAQQKFLDRGFTDKQFVEFQNKYLIEAFQENTLGFSATIFKERTTRE